VRSALSADSQQANPVLAAALADVAPTNTLSLSLTDSAGTLGAHFAARFVNF